jgi:rare lipoprotein A
MRAKLWVLFALASLAWTYPMSAATHKSAKAQNLNSAKVRSVGIASWYGKQHQGKRMANGEKFDRHKLTAACWFLPLGSEVRVRNLANGKEITVLITDRGPAVRLNRIIDLSEEAAIQLDFQQAGTTPVALFPVQRFEPETVELAAELTE